MLRTGIHGMKDMKAPPFGIMLIRTNNTISHKSFVLLTFLIEMYSFSLHFFSIFSCSELKWTVTNFKFVLFADRKGERDTAREKKDEEMEYKLCRGYISTWSIYNRFEEERRDCSFTKDYLCRLRKTSKSF